MITAQAHDATQAQQRSASLVDAILNAPVAASGAPLTPGPPAAGPRAGLQAERVRLVAAADAVDARAIAVSTSLASLARDIAAAGRIAADRKPGRDTLDKGQAALADLQLKRLQLVTKYQDTYPAVLVMDVQIHDLQKFLMDEAHRVDAHPAAPDPSDALLAGERDRLRSELSQLDEQRRELAATIHSLDLKMAALPTGPIAARRAGCSTRAGADRHGDHDVSSDRRTPDHGAGRGCGWFVALRVSGPVRPAPPHNALRPATRPAAGGDSDASDRGQPRNEAAHPDADGHPVRSVPGELGGGVGDGCEKSHRNRRTAALSEGRTFLATTLNQRSVYSRS